MKMNLFAIAITVIMMVVTTRVMGQSQEEIWRTKKAENDAKKQQLQNRIENQIINGVDKTKKQIMDSKPEDGTLYQLKLNQEKLQVIHDSNSTLEQIYEASEFVITEGKDYVITKEGDVKLTSYHGFEVKTAEFSNAIKNYNDNWESFQKIRKECADLNRECIEMESNKGWYGERAIDEKRHQLDNKIAEKKAINAKAMDFSKKAREMAEVILNSTTDSNLSEEVKRFVIDLKKYNRVNDDYKNLMEHLKECTDCGKQ